MSGGIKELTLKALDTLELMIESGEVEIINFNIEDATDANLVDGTMFKTHKIEIVVKREKVSEDTNDDN